MSDPYNSHPSSLPTGATPAPPPLLLNATVVRSKPRPIRNLVGPVNWGAAVAFIAIAIFKHAPFGPAVFMLTPIFLALLAFSAVQNKSFHVIARAINATFACLSLLKLSSRSPNGIPIVALALFAIMVLVPAFNAAFLHPREHE
jgi:hypothetical protein